MKKRMQNQQHGHKCRKNLLIVVFLLLFTAFLIFNAVTNPKFWEASFVNCITIGIAIVISYYFVQKKNDRRKQKDIVLDLIQDIQILVGQKATYDFSGQKPQDITMRARELSNKIHILETIKDDFFISAEVEFVRSKFDEYNDLIGEHIDNLDYLLQSQKELKRPIELIDAKLIETSLRIYE